MRFTTLSPSRLSWRRSFLSIAVLITILAVACGASEPQAPAQEQARRPGRPRAAGGGDGTAH